MNKQFSAIVIILMAVFICVQVPTTQAESGLKKISLTYSDHSPSDTGGATFFKKEYLPRIQKELAKIGYKLDVKYHHNESLYKLTDQVQACEDGLVDITLFTIDWELSRAPLHEILGIPLMGYDEHLASRIWFELQETIPEFGAEFANFKELFHIMVLPNVFNMNIPARIPKDYKGLKIQAPGMLSDMFKSIGANPVMYSPGDWHNAMENNLIDGIAVGITGIPMYNLQDVIKYHIEPTGDSLGLTGTSFVMNRKKFESFPPEVQEVINDTVLWASGRLTAIEVRNIPGQKEICKKSGNTFISLTPTEMMKWYVTIRPLHKKWIRRMEAMGLPGKKVYDEAKRLAEKYKNQS